ncbi:hypothetical protein Tco_1505341 [Tanacetum coccineum]
MNNLETLLNAETLHEMILIPLSVIKVAVLIKSDFKALRILFKIFSSDREQLKKANASLTQELKECRTNLDETGSALGEAISSRDSCLIALQTKQTELEKYTALNDRTNFCPNGEETVTLEKESRSKLDKDKVKPYDYTYQNSLYETFKPPSKTYLDQLEHAKEDLKAQMQDKNIAISELKKLIENCKGKNNPSMFSIQSPKEFVGSNDMVHNYYLEKAKKNAQLQKDKEVNGKPSMIDPARLPTLQMGCKPKPGIGKHRMIVGLPP